ncbi:ABC transporter ATP-binding protein [Roseofilum casamattae]|uniref:ABC transporter ATP-binding protein n=1 Tax=Roseofilum casamattae BLCC-M143 TaxID=3022442 RepID=A0ABT7C1M4_9CYAN|nr:ABC transporter ATP-binding protein [Roseofilum casamattae]MDJ1185352.1 ABC transporter ATP-binding protein [Roseofilum casamattae BLCC-M143]
MSEIAISLSGISKSFKRYAHPVDRLKELLLPGKSRGHQFWALQDISLDIPRGQTLGIVGRNGSGKSTLLQIIAATLTPTTGDVRVNGRISALLELGSGFNPEFTGRQNVFFNGQLLGLTQPEIQEKFESIVHFADIGEFIDEPVKTYSSGMFVRLAFAVATSVEPDILVVDEALSVGDEAFQRKCFARIQEISDRGGTVLFVSHAASSVVELCDRAILMDKGEIILSNTPKFVVAKYQELIYAPADKSAILREELKQLNQQKTTESSVPSSKNGQAPQKTGDPETKPLGSLGDYYDPNLNPKNTLSYISRGAEIIDPHIETLSGRVVNHLTRRQPYIYTFKVHFSKLAQNVRFGMLVKTISGLELGGASVSPSFHKISHFEVDRIVTIRFSFECFLHPGVYFLNAGVSGMVDEEFIYLARCIDAAMFRVNPDESVCGNGTVDFKIEPKLTMETTLERAGETD